MFMLNLQHFALKRPALPGAAATPGQDPGGQAPPVQPPIPPAYQQPPIPPAYQQPPAYQPPAYQPPAVQAQAPVTPPPVQQPQVPVQPPAANTPAVQTNSAGKTAVMDFHNQGGEVVLEGFDEWNGGNYVTIDGSDFYIKSSETRVRELTIVLSFARQYYKWYDKDNSKWHEAPNKVDSRYALSAELKWYDWVEDEPKEFTMSIATTSTLQFREYVQKLRDSGVRINNIWTRMTIERLERIDPETKEKQRYSRAKFENAGPVQYEQQA